MMWASYVGATWSQDDSSDLVWRETKVFTSRGPGEQPTRTLKDEWVRLMPFSPAERGMVWPGWAMDHPRRKARTKRSNVDEGLRNARALENRMHRAGWLAAEVEATWEETRRGHELQLLMKPGFRWHLDSVLWLTQGTGLSPHGVAAAGGLKPGDPFEMAALQEAQDRIASYAQSLGHSTFHSGLVLFEVDTLGKSRSHTVRLVVECLPWDAGGASWSAVAGFPPGTQRPHPVVRMGEITWNGLPANSSERPGGLREDLWNHLVRIRSGQVYKPSNLTSSYSGLSSLRSTRQVNLGQTMRWDTLAVGEGGTAVMDVDLTVVQDASHDIGVGLDVVRNDARYGPKIGATLLHRNPRGWGSENAWDIAFGYVSVSPFSSLNRQTLLNSGEWTVRWSTTQIGIVPLSLSRLRPSSDPFTSLDMGWDREVWPEFTRSQFHIQHDLGFTENPQRGSTIRFSPIDVSFVNLSNRDSAFVDWLENQDNPLIQARFNNHLTLGSSASWETGWKVGRWSGRGQLQTSWAGMLAQAAAGAFASPERLDETSGAWLVSDGVPLIQYQRVLASASARRASIRNPHASLACHVLMGWANAGANTPSLPLEQAFFTGGANGVRGWRLRSLGPGHVNASDSAVAILGVGDVRLDVQVEWRHTFNETWGVALFSDAGNVWLHGQEAPDVAAFQWGDWSSMGWSAGAGLRYDLEFFLLRADGGLRLHDPSQPDGERWIGQKGIRAALHLGLGLPF